MARNGRKEGSIVSDAFLQYLSSGVQLTSGLIFYLFIVRLLDTSTVGAVALFISITGMFSIVFSFGLGIAAQHFASFSLGMNDFFGLKVLMRTLISYGLIGSIIGMVVLLGMSPYISLFLLHSLKYVIYIRELSIVLFGYVIFNILNGTMLGMQHFKISAVINVVTWILYYIACAVAVFYIRSLNTLLMGWIFGIFVGVLLNLILIISFLTKKLPMEKDPSKSPITAPKILLYSLPIMFSNMIGSGAAYADRFILAALSNLSALGIYNFALLISSSIGFIGMPFNNILMPKLSEFYGRNDLVAISKAVNASSILLSAIYVPAAIGIASLAPYLLLLLGGSVYTSGALPLIIIMVSTAMCITQNVFIQVIASIRKTRLFLYSSIISLVSNLTISILLIPVFGLPGAAIGFSSVYITSFFILLYFVKKYRVGTLDTKGLVKVWISAAIMFLVVRLIEEMIPFRPLFLIIYTLVGIFVYVGSVKLLKPFASENYEYLVSLLPKRFSFIGKFFH